MSDPRITDEAVEAAGRAWDAAYWTTSSFERNDWMRAALEATLPHLAPQPVASRSALISTFLEVFDKGGLWDGLEPEAYKVRHRTEWAIVFADAVLALLNGGAS